MGKQRSTFARELDRLVDKKNPDGTPRYTPKDIHALRSMLLLEIARRGNAEVEKLSDSSKVELSFALELIGITPHTNPALIMGMVEKYYRDLGINPEIIIEFNDMLTMLGKQKDRVEAVEQTQKAYDKMMEKDGPKAPKADDPVPEDAEQAQTLTLNLGGKVRI
jgi:hypothetical protein